MGAYDKLGDLLKEAIETENFPESRKPFTSKKENLSPENNSNNSDSTEKTDAKPEEIKIDYRFISFSKEFSVLGIKPTSDINEIKSAYHGMLKKYHPDNVPKLNLVQKTAAKKTQEIVQAYRTLLSQFS